MLEEVRAGVTGDCGYPIIILRTKSEFLARDLCALNCRAIPPLAPQRTELFKILYKITSSLGCMKSYEKQMNFILVWAPYLR